MNNYIKKINYSIKNDYLLVIYLLILIIVQLYFFINFRPLDSYHTNFLFHYYNSKSYLVNAHSFYDFNHPGSLSYLISSFLLKFIGKDIENFYEYYFFSKTLLFIFLIFSITHFFNFFKKKIRKSILFFFLLFFSSYQQFFFNIEVNELISYQYPLTFFSITYFFKYISKENIKHLYKSCIVLAAGLSIKFSFLPLVVILLFFYLVNFFEKKDFFTPVKFFCLFSVFFVIFNFSIIGRIPGILFNIFFRRNKDNEIGILESFNSSLEHLLSFNIFNAFILIFLFLLSFYLIIKNYKKTKKKFFVVQILFLISYAYTFLDAGKELSLFDNLKFLIDNENVFRSSSFYQVFFFVIIYFNKNFFNNIKFKNIIVTTLFINFIISIYFYISERKQQILNYTIYKKEFNNILKIEKINLKETAFSSCNKFSNGIGGLHYTANEIFAGEKFYFEIKEHFDEYYWFRLNDLIAKREISYIENSSNLNMFLIYIDKKLQFLPDFLYNSVTPLSYKKNSIWLYHPDRTRHPLKSNYNIKNILFCDYRFKKDQRIKDFITNEIKQHFEIYQIKKFVIQNYIWYLYTLKS